MGIRIAHEPVGAPILAAYSAGVGRAQSEIADRQSKMWQQQQEMKQRQALLNQQHGFRAEENELNRANQRNLAEERRRHDFDLLDARNQQYRDKDNIDWIMGNIDARQKLILGQPLSPEGQKKWNEMQKELDALRGMRGEYRPEQYQQGLSAWVQKFDSMYDESWKAPKPDPMGEVRDKGMYVMPDGRQISGSDYLDGGMTGGTLLMPDKNGELYAPLGRGGTDSNKASEEWWKTYKQAQSEYKDKVSQIVPGSGVAIPDANTWIQRRMDELDEMRSGKKYTPPSGEMLDPNADLGSRGYKWVPETGQPNGGFWQPDGSAPAGAATPPAGTPQPPPADSMSQGALPQQQGTPVQAQPASMPGQPVAPTAGQAATDGKIRLAPGEEVPEGYGEYVVMTDPPVRYAIPMNGPYQKGSEWERLPDGRIVPAGGAPEAASGAPRQPEDMLQGKLDDELARRTGQPTARVRPPDTYQDPLQGIKGEQAGVPVPKLDDAGQAVLRDIGSRADDLLPPEQAQKVHEAEALIAQYGPNTLQWPKEARIRFEQLMLLGGGK